MSEKKLAVIIDFTRKKELQLLAKQEYLWNCYHNAKTDKDRDGYYKDIKQTAEESNKFYSNARRREVSKC